MVMRKSVLIAMYSTAISPGSYRPLGGFSCTGKFNEANDKESWFCPALRKGRGNIYPW